MVTPFRTGGPFEPELGRAEIWRIPLLCMFSLAQKCFPSICSVEGWANGNAKCYLQCTYPRSAPFPSVELFLPPVCAGSVPPWPDSVPEGS